MVIAMELFLFHQHINQCPHCHDHPFALCLEGLRLLTAASSAVHAVGCLCEDCSAAYERDRRDPRDGR